MNAGPVRRSRAATLFGDALSRGERAVARAVGQQWPSARWRDDPIGFAYYILGVELWEFQRKFLLAIRDHRHVACAGGRKIGKDFAVAVAALWWYASWPKAKVFLLAPTASQLDEILYLEIRQLIDQTGRCVDCKRDDPEGPAPCPHSAVLTGDVGLSTRTGIRAPDFRRIFGKTAARPGNLRGFSGAKVLAIEDEASDIKDGIDAALVGNLASADCHRVLISNPEKPYGFFYRAFHEERDLFHQIQQSSEETPNVVEGRQVFPGLSSREWLEERERAWGRGSVLWAANVEGRFPRSAEGQLFSLDVIEGASKDERRAKANCDGRLQLGVDVAGEGFSGDETGFCLRRGDLVLEMHRQRGMSEDAILAHARDMIARHRSAADWAEDEEPLVVVDRDGSVGARVYDTFNAYRQRDSRTESEFRLIGFRGGAPPDGRMKESYKIQRDVLLAGLVEWIKSGGWIPVDLKLQGELAAFRWAPVELGKSTLEHKDKIRERLDRSPDAADALALSVWRPHGFAAPATATEPAPPTPPMDPYAVPSPYG